ncbi:hypothetical protein C461_11228 [Halorubrum aidingense JCM 13560]|uniref:DUF7573 domain-containing protein n=1 Tax=Halorubrum aidingense JCM 13560 TaxID=1230454 RepID=M0PAN7_9EURY|nr:hypothetical protein [Halorubrum aidingense]EMA66609.1 hypothetical protein C461_11228 [Halorubrum aidingense JCM 13560]
MVEDRSLDEFAGSDAGGVSDSDDTATDPASDDTPTDVDPAVSTSAWIDAGTDCDRCGERATRGWFDDGDLLCADCAEW